MKISEMIKNLQEFMDECGDLDCWYATDDEGNGYNEVFYEPTLFCKHNYDGQIMSIEDAGWCEWTPDEYTKICVVN